MGACIDRGARTPTRSRRQFQRNALGQGFSFGNGISFNPDNGEISLSLATDPALEFSSGLLTVKLQSDGGLQKDSDGLGILLPSASGLSLSASGLVVDLRDATPGLELTATGVGVLLDTTEPGLQLTTGLKVLLASNGGLELSSGLKLEDAVPRWRKFTVGFADLATAATTNDIELLSLPARGVIQAVKIKHSAAFSGGTISAYTISVGITGTLDKYATAFDVFQAAGDTVFQVSSVVGSENDGSAASIRIAASSMGDNLDQASAGSVDVWVLYSVPSA